MTSFPPPAPPQRNRKTLWAVLLVVVLTVAMMTTAVVGVRTFWFGLTLGPAPRYELASEPGDLVFMDDYANQTLAANSSTIRSMARSVDKLSGAVAADSTDALYGGSQDNSACAVESMSSFLAANQTVAAAFGAALGVPTEEVPRYVVGLTPLILTHDTWVTNHGFDGTNATAFQSVLEAGTAVLVDSHGVPRVRCACGNPLLEPEMSQADIRAGDAPWEDYDDGAVVRVQGGGELEYMSYVDLDTGDVRERALGSGQTGEVQMTLQWDGKADLDIHATTPRGNEIYFATKASDGGRLDVDACVNGTSANCSVKRNIENIFWAPGTAPKGDYSAWVEVFKMNGEQSAPFVLEVFAGGRRVDRITGTLTGDEVDGVDGVGINFTYTG